MNKFIILAALLPTLFVSVVSSFAEGLKIEGAWIRMPPPIADSAAGYMVLSNPTDHLVKVKSITTQVAETSEFHSMEMHDGMMHMAKMEDVHIKAKGKLVFDTGSNHLMLVGLKQKLNDGDTVTLEITTEAKEVYTVVAEVRDMRKKKQQDHQHHH